MPIDDDSDRAGRSARRVAAGLPVGRLVQTIHNSPSKITVVEVGIRGEPPLHRLYWRPSGTVSYELVAEPGEGCSLENAITCEVPRMFARQVEWKAKGRDFAGRTTGIAKIELANPPTLATLALDDIIPARAEVSRLLRANDDGTRIDAVVVFMVPSSHDKSESKARYVICSLDLVARSLAELDELPGIQY